MLLPNFLRRDSSEGPNLAENWLPSGSYATRGCVIGCFAAIVFWFVPIPVGALVWMFDLKGPFVDYMLTAIPFFLALPLIGAGVGKLLDLKRVTRRHR